MLVFRLRVENLSSRVSWQDLKDLLRRGGDVTFAEAHTVRVTGVLTELRIRIRTLLWLCKVV